ncbi:LOW QUALITY PROTEIN: protein adenylyltransferase SelO-like [Guaruba guarouba]
MSLKGTSDFLQFVSGGKMIVGSLPLAGRYGGHHFGSWAGQLGGGAHLIGVYSNAIVLHLAKSWFYIGSLKILAHSGELALQRFGFNLHSNYIIFLNNQIYIRMHIYSWSLNLNYLERKIEVLLKEDALEQPDSRLDTLLKEFFSAVISETADLIALWMSGFAHGMCNTDNFSLSITIDYGPFGFMDSYDLNLVPNTSDDERRYKIGNQANVLLFNLSKLLQALKPLLDLRQKQLCNNFLTLLVFVSFTELFKTNRGRGENEDDNYFIAFLLKLMEDTKADFTSVNPRCIISNWMAESAVLKAKLNDFSEVCLLQQILQHPFQRQQAVERAGYSQLAPRILK